jgi:hypothetical protein
MKHLLIAALFAAGCAAQERDVNVNGRYTVESVDVVGIERASLSRTLRQEMQSLVGDRFDEERIDRVLRRLVRDFPDHEITRKVSRGATPGQVKIVFEMDLAGRRDRFDLAMPRGLYHSRSGWSGELEATVRVKTNDFTFGILSDGDRLLERFAGITARYENHHLGTPRARLAFDFESFHQIWNRATLQADPGWREIYRTRQNFQPAVTFTLVRGLKATAGTSFQRFQKQFPAAHTESANAVIGTLRYERSLESSGPNTHRLGAGYGLRAATRSLDSDYVYARHTFDADYALWRGPNKLSLRFTAGTLGGAAPLFERFVLGNSTTLRGWNKYDVAPLGGARAVHNSVDYRYRTFRVFYDTGAVWSKGQDASAKHSAGLGLQIGDFAMLVAFPMKSGRAVPVFMAGLNL